MRGGVKHADARALNNRRPKNVRNCGDGRGGQPSRARGVAAGTPRIRRPRAPGTRRGPARLAPRSHGTASRPSNQPVTMMRGTRDHFVVLAGTGLQKMQTGTTTKVV